MTMKKILLSLGVMASFGVGMAQSDVVNGNFENWENKVVKDSIVEWTTSGQMLMDNGADFSNSYQVGGAQDGNYALHLETVAFNNDTIFGFAVKNAVVNDTFQKFPYNDHVTNLKGWYKSDILNNDTAFVVVQLSLNGVVFSGGLYPITGANSSWTAFDVALPNTSVMTPDSVFIGFTSSHIDNQSVVEIGSWVEIDNIYFENSGTATTPIPNHSFENTYQETIEHPQDWWSFSSMLYAYDGTSYVSKSTDVQEGNYSLKIEKTTSLDAMGLFPIVTNGIYDFNDIDPNSAFIGGIPFTAQATGFSFEYKFTPAGVDTAGYFLKIWKDGVALPLVNTFDYLYSTSGSWQTETKSLNLTQAPDSAQVTFFGGGNAGSVLLIDDVKFIGGDVSVPAFEDGGEFAIYPNPASDVFYVNNVENSYVTILNMSGEQVFNEYVNQSVLPVETTNWSNGVYLV